MGNSNMSASCELLSNYFPSLDTELADYINGVIDDSDEFETTEELYDAIGVMLQEAARDKPHEEIYQICEQLMGLMKGNCDNDYTYGRKLDAPVNLAEMAQSKCDDDTLNNHTIWISRQDKGFLVDKKKLDKAEAKIKKKQDKISETVNNNKIGNSLIIEEASVSQMGDRKETNKDKAGTNMA